MIRLFGLLLVGLVLAGCQTAQSPAKFQTTNQEFKDSETGPLLFDNAFSTLSAADWMAASDMPLFLDRSMAASEVSYVLRKIGFEPSPAEVTPWIGQNRSNLIGDLTEGLDASPIIEFDDSINELTVENYGENYLEYNGTHWDSIIPVNPPSGSGFDAYVKVANGVLEDMQTVANGAIAKSGLGYGDILNSQGWVRIFDYNRGTGATGYVSKVGSLGEVLEITIEDGGRDYESNTSVIFIVKEYNGYATNGYGFESGVIRIKDGIANDYAITDHGSDYSLNTHLVNVSKNSFGVWQSTGSPSIQTDNSKYLSTSETKQYFLRQGITKEDKFYINFPQTDEQGSEVYYLNESQILELTGQISSAGYYTANEWLEFVADSSTGFGFQAKAYASNLRDGSLKIELTNPGESYLTKPLVILQGGSLLPGDFGAKESLQITAGNKILLLADASDFDGQVESVRFYGNGKDLGTQIRKVFQSVTLTSPGFGYTQAPEVTLEGGGGTGAEAVAQLEDARRNEDGQVQNNPRGLVGIALTNPGSGYTQAPTVIISGGGGGGARGRANVVESEIETQSTQLVPGLDRWALEWIPTSPGTYLIELEVTDDKGDITFVPTKAEIIVLPVVTSKSPKVDLFSEYDGESFTNKSSLRFTARASDVDGKLMDVQFYVNGQLLGEKIQSNYIDDQYQQPYSVEFSPTESGVYTVYAIARDNSGNYAMSDSVTFTTTKGEGSAPVVRITKPTMAAEGEVIVENGKVKDIEITNNGFGYVQSPEISILGSGYGAEANIDFEKNLSSPKYSQVNDNVLIVSEGQSYKSPKVDFIGGFMDMKASGQLAKAEIIRSSTVTNTEGGGRRTDYSYRVVLESGGAGYTAQPRAVITNGPEGMTAEAEYAPVSGTVSTVTITNQGQDSITPYDPQIIFVGGLNYSEILIDAFVDDAEGDKTITEVAFYVNGMLIQTLNRLDSNPDLKAPYQILWSPGGPGIYEIYATAEDSDGNLFTSPVIRREAFLSKPPSVEFNPSNRAYGYLMPDSLDENGSITNLGNTDFLPTSSLINQGYGYHSFPTLEFEDYRGALNLNQGGSGASAEVLLQDGLIAGIKVLAPGSGYAKYKKLTGSVKLGAEDDLLLGIQTDFMNELEVGQPLLFGLTESDVPDISLGTYEIMGFQPHVLQGSTASRTSTLKQFQNSDADEDQVFR